MATSLLATTRQPSKTTADTSSSIPTVLRNYRHPTAHRDSRRHHESFPALEHSPSRADDIDAAFARNCDPPTEAPNPRDDDLDEQALHPENELSARHHKPSTSNRSKRRQDGSTKPRDWNNRTLLDAKHINGGESKQYLSPSRDHPGPSINDEPILHHHRSSESPAWPKHRRPSASRPSTSPASSYHSPRPFLGDERGSYFAWTPHQHPDTDSRSPSALPAGFSPAGVAHIRPATSGEASPSARSPYTPTDPTTPLRSPPLRRPPASRSAHGIETAFGPPPALSTQRSYSTDRWRRAVAAANSDRGLGLHIPAGQGQIPKGQSPTSPTEGGEGQLTFQALEQLDAAAHASVTNPLVESGEINGTTNKEDRESGVAREELEENPSSIGLEETHHPNHLEPESHDDSKMDAKSSQLPTATPQRRSLLGSVRPRSNSKRLSAQRPPDPVAQEGQSQSSHEDLFFDLAKGEDYQTPSNEERKPSRIALPSHRPSISHTGIGTEDGEVKSSPLAHIRRRSLQRGVVDAPPQSPTVRNPTVKHRSYAASAHPLDSQRVPSRLMERAPQPILTNAARPKEERSPELPSRRQSITENFSRPYRASYLQHMTNGSSYSSPIPPRAQLGEAERSPPPPRHEGTESTVSTTAPSTVWDELDDLKSRIRKLEFTGKLPSSGNAMSGNGERPQTATTTVTTISSSPKRLRQHSVSPAEPGADGEEPLHPLLRSALAKNQGQVTTAVYRALEACANEALAIAQTSTSTQHQSVAQSTLERMLKRKADSLCRSMTELCIALAESRVPFSPGERQGSASRPGSRSGTATLRRPDLTIDTETRYSRAQSLDPEPTSARVLSRLEARRSSLAGGRSGGEFLSSSRDTSHSRRSPSREREASGPDAATATTPTQSTLGRNATVTQRRHLEGLDGDRTLRPLSRARTDAGARGTLGTATSKRVSREYTSQYPLPSPAAEVRSPLAMPRERGEARRSYLNSTVSSTMRRTERDARNLSEARADDDDTLTMPTTPSTTIGPDDRRRSLAEARERERARDERLRLADRDGERERARDERLRLAEHNGDRSQERPRLPERDSDRSTRNELLSGIPGANGEGARPFGNPWQDKYATVREARRAEARVEARDERRGDERPSGIAAPAAGASSGSAALERAQKRLSGSYAASRLSGRFAQGIRTVPRD